MRRRFKPNHSVLLEINSSKDVFVMFVGFLSHSRRFIRHTDRTAHRAPSSAPRDSVELSTHLRCKALQAPAFTFFHSFLLSSFVSHLSRVVARSMSSRSVQRIHAAYRIIAIEPTYFLCICIYETRFCGLESIMRETIFRSSDIDRNRNVR